MQTWVDAQPNRYGKIYGTYPARKQFYVQLTPMERQDLAEYELECWHEANARAIARQEAAIADAQRWHDRAGDETSARGLAVMRRQLQRLKARDRR